MGGVCHSIHQSLDIIRIKKSHFDLICLTWLSFKNLNDSITVIRYAPVAQLDRVPDYESGG